MEDLRRLYDRWELPALLMKYGGLQLQPVSDGTVRLSGKLAFDADFRSRERLADEYEVRIEVPATFPKKLASVWERGKRIPSNFHSMSDGSLCLGSETRLRLLLSGSNSLIDFVDRCVVPYLYGYSYFLAFNRMPFGELSHGTKGIVEDLADLFGCSTGSVLGFVTLAAMKKRVANKRLCPCGTELRLGTCHSIKVNVLRKRVGRRWFRHLRTELTS